MAAVRGNSLVDGSTLTTSTATYFTSTNLRTRVDKATVCNDTGGAQTFTLYRVPLGGAASGANKLVSARSVGPGETYLCPELVGHWLPPGYTIQASASVDSALNIMVSGIET